MIKATWVRLSKSRIAAGDFYKETGRGHFAANDAEKAPPHATIFCQADFSKTHRTLDRPLLAIMKAKSALVSVFLPSGRRP